MLPAWRPWLPSAAWPAFPAGCPAPAAATAQRRAAASPRHSPLECWQPDRLTCSKHQGLLCHHPGGCTSKTAGSARPFCVRISAHKSVRCTFEHVAALEVRQVGDPGRQAVEYLHKRVNVMLEGEAASVPGICWATSTLRSMTPMHDRCAELV